MTCVLRFVLRVLLTPPFAVAFGILAWLGGLVIMGPMFQIFSFLDGEQFSWRDHIEDCNDFFMEPLRDIWGGNIDDLRAQENAGKAYRNLVSIQKWPLIHFALKGQ